MALSVVCGLKRAVTMFAMRNNNIEFGWQSRFHDHVIRNASDSNKINDYIKKQCSPMGL